MNYVPLEIGNTWTYLYYYRHLQHYGGILEDSFSYHSSNWIRNNTIIITVKSITSFSDSRVIKVLRSEDVYDSSTYWKDSLDTTVVTKNSHFYFDTVIVYEDSLDYVSEQKTAIPFFLSTRFETAEKNVVEWIDSKRWCLHNGRAFYIDQVGLVGWKYDGPNRYTTTERKCFLQEFNGTEISRSIIDKAISFRAPL